MIRDASTARRLRGRGAVWGHAGLLRAVPLLDYIKLSAFKRAAAACSLRPERARPGTAYVVREDDAHERHRQLGKGTPGYQVDRILLRALSSLGSCRTLTIRIHLGATART